MVEPNGLCDRSLGVTLHNCREFIDLIEQQTAREKPAVAALSRAKALKELGQALAFAQAQLQELTILEEPHHDH
ncbi:MAG: hypothetical protein ACREMY_08860 [bacterium]